MQFRILGPVEVWRDGEHLPVAGPKQRALLAILLMHRNRVVAAERLIELLWGDDSPDTASHSLQVHVSQLRKLLPPKMLDSRPPGYVLYATDEQVDGSQFESRVAKASQLRRAGDLAGAVQTLREALSLWHGEPLADVATAPFAIAEVARLTELRLRAIEERLEAELVLGHHADLLPELEALVAEHPLREQLCGQLMLALYRSGQQAEASDLYQRTRAALVEQLGMDPGPNLQKLLKHILNQDPSLDPPITPEPPVDVATGPVEATVPAPLRRERKVVSVLFCDLRDADPAPGGTDPEDVQARWGPYYQAVRREIERFGGTTERFLGNSVLAVFGAPIAHEDDPERAVRAGLSIVERLGALNQARPGFAVSARVGVSTGEAIVSWGAGTNQAEGLATGDVVRAAGRIQAAAPINEVVVGRLTHYRTRQVFQYEPLASKEIAVWRALAPVARVGSDVLRSLTAPLVGRELELVQLRTLFDRTVRERTVQLVTIVGEPGVGKTRLVAELLRYVEGLDELVTWRQGRCLPYGEGIAFWALGEIVKAHAGIYESDSASEATSKLEAVLPESADRPWLRARLLPLLGIESSPAGQEEAFSAWRRFLEWVAELGPAVLVIEDIHWADEALLRFLGHLADWALHTPLFLVCTARPELYAKQSTWGAGLSNQTTIRLSPLSDVETAQLVTGLLEQAAMPAETQELLLGQAGGNPLYAEEFVRMLRDRGRLSKRGTITGDLDVPVPDSIQALIAARLDTLPLEQKLLLQDAAVIGKVFWAGAVAAMGDREPRHVEEALHQLARHELVRAARHSSMEGEIEYAFWHMIVRDVAYGQIPRAERAAKHVQIVTWLEAKAGARVEDLAGVLAYHTDEARSLAQASGNSVLAAELTSAASKYALMAGERALALDAGKALALLDRARDLTPESDRRFPLILRRWAEAARNAGRLPEAARALEQAVAAFKAQADVRSAGESLMTLSFVHHHLGKPGYVEIAERAVALLEEEPGAELVDALGGLAGARHTLGGAGAAVAIATRAIQLADQLELPVSAQLHGIHGLARCYQGELDGLAEMEHALKLSRAAGDGRSAAILYNNLAVVSHALKGPVAAAAQFEQGRTFAEARGLPYFAQMIAVNRVLVLVVLGELEEALGQAEALATSLQEGGSQIFLGILRGCQARVLTELGRDSSVAGEEALRLARDSHDPMLVVQAVAATSTSMLSLGKKAMVAGLLADIASADYHDDPEYAFDLPALARSASQLGDPELLAQLTSSVGGQLAIQLHAVATARALEAELRGDYRRAAELYAAAASRWEGFGNRFEQAHALLGEGRCLTAGRDHSAELSLRRARELFKDMGARSRVAECESLIDRMARVSS
jgi:DNA-binding SARP family transcriptional activator/class 3 adenylate cyclase/tetratricopeptide (TPR) repeat protein